MNVFFNKCQLIKFLRVWKVEEKSFLSFIFWRVIEILFCWVVCCSPEVAGGFINVPEKFSINQKFTLGENGLLLCRYCKVTQWLSRSGTAPEKNPGGGHKRVIGFRREPNVHYRNAIYIFIHPKAGGPIFPPFNHEKEHGA